MSASSQSHRLETRSVSKLLREIEDGHFAVPKLQRAFVWSGEKAAMLLDSVVRGLPVGVITAWNAQQKHSHQLPNTLHILPQPAQHHRIVRFVLDGQQRLSVLYNVARGSQRRNARRQEVDFTRVVLVLRPEQGGRLVEYRKAVEGDHVPISELLGTAWRSRTEGLRKRDRDYARKVRRSIMSYRMGLSIFEAQDLEAARELFIRINSSGTPLASADRAFARAQRIDLRAKATTIREKLGDRWAGISNEMILQALALASNIGDVGARAQDQVAKHWEARAAKGDLKEFEVVWRRASEGILKAVDTLNREFGVSSTGVLPSQYMVATLAQYHAVRSTLTPHARTQVHAWFWATAIGQRYSGRGFRSNVTNDAAFFRSLGEGKLKGFPKGEWVPPADLRQASYGRRSSITDAVTLLLASKKPKDLLSGVEILLSEQLSAASATHRHHVFPRGFLARHRVPLRSANSVLNLCLVSAGTNSTVGSKAPWKYLDESCHERWYDSMLKRSLIPDPSAERFRVVKPTTAYRRFLDERQAMVIKAIESASGRRIFARD